MPDLAAKLDGCLAALRDGKSLARQLRRYPHERDQLIELLRVSTEVGQLSLPAPDPAFKLRARNVMLAAAARRRAQAPRAIGWVRRPAFRLAMAVGLAAGLAGAGVAAASAQSLPGDPLYAVKRGVEGVQLAVTVDPAANARLRLVLANRRLAEAEQLSGQGRITEALSLVTTYRADVTALHQQVATAPLRPTDADELEREVGQGQAEADSRLNAVAAQFTAHGHGEAAATVKHTEDQADETLAGTRTALHNHRAGSPGSGHGGPQRP